MQFDRVPVIAFAKATLLPEEEPWQLAAHRREANLQVGRSALAQSPQEGAPKSCSGLLRITSPEPKHLPQWWSVWPSGAVTVGSQSSRDEFPPKPVWFGTGPRRAPESWRRLQPSHGEWQPRNSAQQETSRKSSCTEAPVELHQAFHFRGVLKMGVDSSDMQRCLRLGHALLEKNMVEKSVVVLLYDILLSEIWRWARWVPCFWSMAPNDWNGWWQKPRRRTRQGQDPHPFGRPTLA